jgi:Spy/CpxP family protein refolding chaperone
MNYRNLTAALSAALIAFPLAAWAGPASLSLDPPAGSSAQFHLSFDGHLWNGQHKVYEHEISLTRTSDTQVHAIVDKQESGQRADFSATRNADGVLVPANPEEQFSAYNAIASLANAAPEALAPGRAWDTHVVVDLGDSVSVSVPVHAWVATVNGQQTIVQGTGTLSTSVTYSGFTVPIDLSIRLASDFDGGTFARADSSATEVIHAGPQTQTLDWTWSLKRT